MRNIINILLKLQNLDHSFKKNLQATTNDRLMSKKPSKNKYNYNNTKNLKFTKYIYYNEF